MFISFRHAKAYYEFDALKLPQTVVKCILSVQLHYRVERRGEEKKYKSLLRFMPDGLVLSHHITRRGNRYFCIDIIVFLFRYFHIQFQWISSSDRRKKADRRKNTMMKTQRRRRRRPQQEYAKHYYMYYYFYTYPVSVKARSSAAAMWTNRRRKEKNECASMHSPIQ